MVTSTSFGPATHELCRLSLDYAWLHTIANAIIVLLFVAAGRRKALLSAHCFGAFAMIMDLGIMYLLQATRTVDYASEGDTGPFPFVPLPPYPVNISDVPVPPMPPMTPAGTLAFFFWFDYLGALGMILFAFSSFEGLLSENWSRSALDWVTLAVTPILFWSAPLLSPKLGIDGRVLVVTRPSPKTTYVKMLVGFFVPLVGTFPLNDVIRVYLTGVACGLVHHAALFYWGMRGYNDVSTLVIILATEWPALVSGVFCSTAFVQFCAKKTPHRFGAYFCAVTAVFVAAIVSYLAQADIEGIISDLLPYIPGEWMHNLGTFYFRWTTCGHRKIDCFDDADDAVLVMATVAKGGAMLAAKLIFEVSLHCGLCLAGGSREGPGMPGEQELVPTFEGDSLLAVINMRGWPAYVNQMQRTHKCVAFARDPGDRLRSYYLYSRSGGEYWVRSSGIMRRLNVPNTTASIQDFWEFGGRGYLEQSHAYLKMNQKEGCAMIPYPAFKTDFNSTVLEMLVAWGIKEEHHGALLSKSQKYDFGRWSKKALVNDPHHSSSKFPPSLVREVEEEISNHPDIKHMLEKMRSELAF